MNYEQKYEQKYREALGWMRSLYDGLHGATKEDAEHYFPELKESEDERVKKRILLSLEKDLMATKNSGCSTKDLEDCITWLEKQGKLKEEDKKENIVVRYPCAGDPIPCGVNYGNTSSNKGVEFKIGDKVIISCREKFYTTYNGKEGTIIDIFDLKKNRWGNIIVELDNGMRNAFYASELIKNNNPYKD